MLVQFSVANYLSFREKVTLSMVAANSRSAEDRALEGNTFEAPGRPGLRLLKSAAIYGANAAGKSNLVKALAFMRAYMLFSTEQDRGRAGAPMPFRLDPACRTEPSRFEMAFVLNGRLYDYAFSVDAQRVVAESLHVTEARKKLLFERGADGAITFGDAWRGERAKLAQRTRPEALFLTTAGQWNHPVAVPIGEWLLANLVVGPPASAPGEWMPSRLNTVHEMRTAPGFRQLIVDFVRFADASLADLEAVREEVPFDDAPEAIRQGYLRNVPPDTLPRSVGRTALTAKRLDSVGDTVSFNFMTEESDGTRRLFDLAARWLHAADSPYIFAYDELDTHLHPLLMRSLVERIHRTEASQLIFTTHDSSLLDADLLRRDQIWFVEKTPEGATDLYSLWDFKPGKPKPEENYRKGYLEGRYGAIPFIGDLSLG